MISLKDKNVLLVNAFDDEIEQEGNGKYQLSFKYPTSDQRWKNIELADLLLADDLHGEQEFRVFEIVKRNGYIFVYANQVVDDLNSYSISNISVDRVNGQTVMQALAGSIIRKHPFAFYSDIQDRHVFNQKNIGVMGALANGKHSIIGQWGGDLVRDKYNVNLLKRGGRESEALFMYKKNLKSYAETNSIKGLFTRLNLSVKNSDIKTTVDSPLIGSYGGRVYELNVEVADQDVATLEQLQEYGRNYFAEKLIDVPNNSLTISVTDSQEYDVRIFDTVFVHHEIFDKDLRMKITSYRFSPMGRKLKSIGFGKIKTSLTQQVSNIATEVVEQSVSVAGQVFEEKLQKEIENADKVIDGKINKVRDEINDGIEQSRAEAERHADNIKRSIDTEITQVNQSMQTQSEEHDRQVADILSKTQSVESLANQAKSDAANALSKALQYKNEAIAEATRLDTVERQATETKLATAKSQAISEATRLIETAKSLLSGQISNISTDLSQTKEAIKLLATRATVEALTGRISSAESTLQVQAGEIASRVKTSDFDQAKQRISTAESSITQLGNRITTEISETVAKIPTEVGGRNYILKSQAEISSTGRWVSKPFNLSSDLLSNLSKIKTVTISCDVEGANVSTINSRKRFGLACSVEINGVVNYWEVWQTQDTTKKRISQTFTVPDGKVITKFHSPTLWIQAVGDIKVSNPKIEFGRVPTDHTLAPEDLIDELSSVKTTITQTARGVEQLSTSLSATDNKITTAEANIRNLVDEVSSKVSQTDYNTLTGRVENTETAITQNAQEISKRLTKTQVNQAILADKKIKDTRGDNQSPQWYWTNYPRQTVEEFKTSTVIGLTGESAYAILTTNVQWDDSSGGKVKQTAKTDRATFERYGAGTTWEAWTKIANAGDLANYTTKTEFQTVLETTSLYERTIGAVGETGSILDNISKVTQTAAGLVTEVSGTNGLKTQVSTLAGSYAIKNLTKAGDVLGQINLNKDGSVRINEGLISIGERTYIKDGVISSAKIGDLSAGKITSGTLDAARIKANSIDGSKLKFDQAFFNGLTANEAYLRQLFAKSAFITQVQAVTLSASQVTSGILKATNGAMDINLDNANITFNQDATINFNSDSNALVRKKGDVTAFVNFADDSISGGVYAGFGVTSHAVGVTTASNSDRGKFAGMRVYRPNDSLDLVRLIGDTIELRHGTEGKYFYFNPPQLRNNVDMLKLAGAVYTLSRIFMHLSANGWAFDHPSFISGVKNEMARNWLQDFANGGLPR